VELLEGCWHIAFYEMTEKPTATTTKCFEPLFIIIINKTEEVTGVALRVL